MPRPKKVRNINFDPEVTYFKPQGIPLRLLKTVHISHEEMEAIRLKDYEGLDQTIAATKMGVSQSTFQRILTQARQKISDGLITGKAIEIVVGE